MAATRSPARRRARGGVLAAVLLGVVMVSGCVSAAPVAERAAAPAAATALQPPDVVDLTVYFRRGRAAEAHLVPVTREVALTEELPRRALELLLAGPTAEDGEQLSAPLPTSTVVRAFRVDGDVARVDLSAEVIADRAAAGASADHELLALAALANTLTEFPEIEQVELRVQGRDAGPLEVAGQTISPDVADFWGWWGLPARLVRDESVVGPPPDGAALPQVGRFHRRLQILGASDAQALVDAVRVRSRATSLRVTVELSDPARGAVAAAVPAASARTTPDGVLLEVDGITAVSPDVSLGAARVLSEPPFTAVTVDGGPSEPLRVLVTSREPHDFLLHTLPSPTRLVLDLRK